MMRLWVLLSLPIFTISASAGSFGSSAKGTSSASFLKMGVGARAVSMGEAYSALADEASALYWNPAAMTRIQRRSATFMHAALLDSSFLDYGAYAQSLGKNTAAGIGFQYYSAGSIVETDQTGTEIGKFTPNDLAVSLGVAHRMAGDGPISFLQGFSAGISAKYIRSALLASAQTAAVDIGILSPRYLGDKLSVALTVVNLGGKLKFEQESEALPLVIRIGSALRMSPRVAASLDIGFPKDNVPFVAAGGEYLLWDKGIWNLATRAGFNTRTMGNVDGFTGLSFGLGFLYRGFSFDYGFLPMGGVGQLHRVSVTRTF